MKAKLRPLLEQCIENGAARGWHRAHKHVENPSREAILECIEDCIMSEIYEWFDFEQP